MKSRRSLLVVASILCVSPFVSLEVHADTIVGNGKMINQSRPVGAFSSVHASSGIHVTIVAGAAGVVLHGEENILPLVRVEVHDDALEVGFLPNSSHTSHELEVKVTAPQIHGLSVSGGARIDDSAPVAGDKLGLAGSGGGQIEVTTPIKAHALAVDASGGALIEVARIEVDTLDCAGSGGARVSLTGKATHGRVALSGGSAFEAGGLAMDDLELEGSGGASAEVDVRAVHGALSGAASLTIPASASASVATSGAATVNRRR